MYIRDLNKTLYQNAGMQIMTDTDGSPVRIGQRGGFRIGICSSHPDVTAGGNIYDNCARISAAAMLVRDVRLNRISVATGENCIFGEYNFGGTRGYFRADTENAIWERLPGDLGIGPDVCQDLPAVLAAVVLDSMKGIFGHKLAEDFRNALNGDLTSVYRFCDSVLYNYVAGAANGKREPGRILVGDGLDLYLMKTQYRTGVLKADAGVMNGCPPCTLFEGMRNRYAAAEKGETKVTGNMKEYLAGKHIIRHQWTQRQLERVQPLSYLEEYVPTKTFYKVMNKLDLRIGKNMTEKYSAGIWEPFDVRNDYVNMLFWGDPGTGKTVLANALSAAAGMPIYEITFNEDSEDDEFEGKNKIVDGKLSFVETAFLEGFQNGGILLLEEVNLARANVFTSVLNQAMEYPYILKRNGYERITRNPFTVIIGTMNVDTEGTSPLNSSSAQRFVHKYQIEEPTDREFIRVLTSKGYTETDSRYVYMVYKKLRTDLKSSDQKRKYLKELSIRQCIGALSAMQEGVEPKEAIIDSMYGALAVRNKKLADTIRDSVIMNFVDYDAFAAGEGKK